MLQYDELIAVLVEVMEYVTTLYSDRAQLFISPHIFSL